MSDIDLIPQAYRTRRWQSRWMKNTAYLTVGLAGTLVLAWTVLGVAIVNTKSEVDRNPALIYFPDRETDFSGKPQKPGWFAF